MVSNGRNYSYSGVVIPDTGWAKIMEEILMMVLVVVPLFVAVCYGLKIILMGFFD